MTGRERIPVGGEVPSPIAPPSGCHFSPALALRQTNAAGTKHPELPISVRMTANCRCHAVEEGRLEAEVARASGERRPPPEAFRPSGSSSRLISRAVQIPARSAGGDCLSAPLSFRRCCAGVPEQARAGVSCGIGRAPHRRRRARSRSAPSTTTSVSSPHRTARA